MPETLKRWCFCLVVLFVFSCTNENQPLIKIFEGEYDEIGVPSGYVNLAGDTIIGIGKYQYCYTDTIWNFGIVLDQGQIIGIDNQGFKLFEVYPFDNGPDPIQEGLYRIIQNGLVGYANAEGEIVIQPKYACAQPFLDGVAKVSFDCQLIEQEEHTMMQSNNWLEIDRRGEIVEK